RFDPNPQDSRWNLGLHYTPSPGVRVTVGWERGNELLATVALRSNLKNLQRRAGPLDPPKVPLRSEVAGQDETGSNHIRNGLAASSGSLIKGDASSPVASDAALLPGYSWEQVRSQLIENAGFYLRRVEHGERELILHGNQTHYLYISESVGRGARVLDNAVDPGIDWFTFEYNRQDLPIAQASVSRSALDAYAHRDIDLDTLVRSVEINAPGSSREGAIVYDRPFTSRWSAGLSPGLKEIIGGPDGFILYQ